MNVVWRYSKCIWLQQISTRRWVTWESSMDLISEQRRVLMKRLTRNMEIPLFHAFSFFVFWKKTWEKTFCWNCLKNWAKCKRIAEVFQVEHFLHLVQALKTQLERCQGNGAGRGDSSDSSSRHWLLERGQAGHLWAPKEGAWEGRSSQLNWNRKLC